MTGHKGEGYALAQVDGVYDGVGALALKVGIAVDEGDEHAYGGQEPEQPGEARAQPVGAVHAQVEGRAYEPAGSPGDRGYDEPFCKNAQEPDRSAQFGGNLFGQGDTLPQADRPSINPPLGKIQRLFSRLSAHTQVIRGKAPELRRDEGGQRRKERQSQPVIPARIRVLK